MAVTQYVGARYVPLFADPIDWVSTRTYEPLTIVYYQGNSYTSRQAVPTGIDITNDDYWALTGNYNAQIEQYRAEVQQVNTRINGVEQELNGVEQDLTSLENIVDKIRFETVSDMASFSGLASGDIVETLGYHAIGDGGGAVYAIGKGAANGFGIIQCQGGLVATIADYDVCNVKQYGAYGDGTHDDTAVFNHCMTLGKDVFIPQGENEYRITSTISIGSAMNYKRVFGESIWSIDNTNRGVVFDTSASNNDTTPIFNVTASGVHFKGFTIQSDTDVYRQGLIGIQCGSSSTSDTDCLIEMMCIKNVGICINHQNRGLRVNDCTLANCGRCVQLSWTHGTESGVDTMRGIIITNNRFHNANSADIYIVSGSCVGMIVMGNVKDSGAGMLINALNDSNPTDCVIANNSCTSFSGTYFMQFTGDCQGISITDNIFKATSNISQAIIFNNDSSDDIEIMGNLFENITADVVLFMGNAHGGNISNNIIDADITSNRGILAVNSTEYNGLIVIGNTIPAKSSHLFLIRGNNTSVFTGCVFYNNTPLLAGNTTGGTPQFNNCKKDWS